MNERRQRPGSSIVTAVVLVVIVLVTAALAWRWFEGEARRRRDVAAADAVLDHFPPPSNATAAERQVQALRSEAGKVFGHTLRVTYGLPPTTRPFEVFDHYDAVVPSGWHVADGRDCSAMMIPPPLPAPGRPPVVVGPLVTSAPRTQRFYTDGERTVSVRVWRDGGNGSVRLEVSNRRGMPDCTEAPDGGPDPAAAAFG